MMPLKTSDIHDVIAELKETDIYGCITGSCLLDADFSLWEEQPDIDVFVYSEQAMIHAVDLMMFRGFEPLESGYATKEGELWKINRLIRKGGQKNSSLSTIRLVRDGVKLNFTWRKGQTTAIDVITNFDMSIIMRAWDIPKRYDLDMRGFNATDIMDKLDGLDGIKEFEPLRASLSSLQASYYKSLNVVRPNPLREQDTSYYNVWQWVRQFDRCIKYWNRGFDTRPMAKFYVQLIDDFLRTGKMFLSEESASNYDEWASTFVEVLVKILAWLEDKEEVVF